MNTDGKATLARQVSCDKAIKAAGTTDKIIPRSCAGFDRNCGNADLAQLPKTPTGAILAEGCPARKL